MLQFLRIQHLAVIDRVEVEFGPGLNILTGETGAGKSILIEAVGLLLGGRASGDLVRTGEDLATVEAIFDDGGHDLIIRREVTSQGRSRAFVNGTLQTAGALREWSARLVELHGQHEHHTLLDPSTHLAILDAYGGLDRLTASTASAFDRLRTLTTELADLRRASADRDERRALLEFQASELDRAAPTPGEDEQLATTRQVLASAERVERLCSESYAALYESDHAVLAQLGVVWRRVGDLAALDGRFQPYLESRDAIKAQLEDLATMLRRYAEGIEASPERLQEVEARLALLERLKRKYGPTLAEVIARGDRVHRELAELGSTGERSAELEQACAHARATYLAAAQALMAARQRVAPQLTRELETILGDLAMERTRLELRFGTEPPPEAEWRADGMDTVEFLVSPNPGEELRPLARIASGGELSRIMLAIKTASATRRGGWTDAEDRPPSAAAPGLIFDEVDAGIGGRAADVVGRKLRSLASTFQVLCITHLPQVAAHADTHIVIDKRVEDGRTVVRVATLDEHGRVNELARMLGGEAVTDRIRASAREMLHGRRLPPDADGGREGPVAKGESERAKAKGAEGQGRLKTRR